MGAIAAADSVTLTKVFLDGTKTAQFGEEQAGFELWRAKPIEVGLADTPPTEVLRLTTIEISTRQQEFRGTTALLSFRPSSVDWFAWSRFKRVTHNPVPQIRKLMAVGSSVLSSREAAVWAAIETLGSDLFGNEKTLYARFLPLHRTDSLDASGRYYPDENRGSIRGEKRNRQAPGANVTLGICNEFKECRESLRASTWLVAALERAQDGMAAKHDGSELQLTGTARSMAPQIWEAAIVKALAGIGPKERASLETDKRSAKYGTVAVLARRIFEEDLRNLHKRTSGEPAAFEIPLSSGPITGIEPSPRTEAPARASALSAEEIAKNVARHRARLRIGADQVRDAWIAVLSRLNAFEDEQADFDQGIANACIYAAALAGCYPPIPASVLERLESLRTQYPLFVEAAVSR